MNITIVTPWRQRETLVHPYREQAQSLDWPYGQLRFIFVEGDSTDATREMLARWALQDDRVTLLRHDVNAPYYPSVVDSGRFRILAEVFNIGLEAVEPCDSVLFLPCDIKYEPSLLRKLAETKKSFVSPFVFQNGIFYDTWAFQLHGHSIGAFKQARTLEMFGHKPIEMESTGCVTLFDYGVISAGARYDSETVDRGFCAAARDRGFKVWADPTTQVYHGH